MLGYSGWSSNPTASRPASPRSAALRRAGAFGERSLAWSCRFCRLCAMSMDSELQKHYALLLGIGSPEEVKTVDLNLEAKQVEIELGWQSVRSELGSEHRAVPDVEQIYSTARELTRSMDEIVWAVNPEHDTLDSLVTYLGRFAQRFLSVAGIRCRLDAPLDLPALALTSEIRHNVFLAFKEALHNVVKHAQATEVRLSLELRPEGFMLVIADNGRGFRCPPGQAPALEPADGQRLVAGNGLANMQKRLREIGGCCEWETAPGEGTRAKLMVVVKAWARSVIKTDDRSEE